MTTSPTAMTQSSTTPYPVLASLASAPCWEACPGRTGVV